MERRAFHHNKNKRDKNYEFRLSLRWLHKGLISAHYKSFVRIFFLFEGKIIEFWASRVNCYEMQDVIRGNSYRRDFDS